jgi:hypothetical protein
MTDEVRIPDAAREPAAYVEALLAVLGDRDPLEVLETTPSSLSAAASDLAAGDLDHVPAPGEWSARDVLGHLLDVEVVYGFRMRLTLTEDGASYPGYDEKRWAALPKPGFAPVLDAFAALRRVNLHLLRTIPRTEWGRVGRHGEQGPDPFDLQVRKLAGHDLAHLDQLERAARGRTA